MEERRNDKLSIERELEMKSFIYRHDTPTTAHYVLLEVGEHLLQVHKDGDVEEIKFNSIVFDHIEIPAEQFVYFMIINGLLTSEDKFNEDFLEKLRST